MFSLNFKADICQVSGCKVLLPTVCILFLTSCGGGGASEGSAPVQSGTESGLGIATQETGSETGTTSLAPGFYDLPNDWSVIPVELQSCDVSTLGGVENVYTETASKLFTWITGTVEEAHYEPIGEVANYFGFAALRNELRDLYGDGADQGFRGAAYREVLELLDDSQRAILYELLDEHRAALTGFLSDRILLIDELWALKEDESLDFDRVNELMLSVGEYEGEITVITAQKYGELMATLTPAQLQYLEDMRTLSVSVETMQATVLTPYGADANAEFEALNELDADYMAEVSSKIVSWSTGDMDDSIFLPTGKISNFFGFSDYRYLDETNVSRGDAAGFVDSVIRVEQREILCGLSTNVVDYTNDYIEGRADLITNLDPLRDNAFLPVNGFAEAYADLAGTGEGQRAVVEALTFHLIESMMSEEQIQILVDIRRGD